MIMKYKVNRQPKEAFDETEQGKAETVLINTVQAAVGS